MNDAYDELVNYVQSKVAELSDAVRNQELKEERKRVKQRYSKALDPLTKGLNQVKSNQYKFAVNEADKQIRRNLRKIEPVRDIKNAHWECLDCGDSWKAPIGTSPTVCREYSVGRDGQPTEKPGCGSTNVKRKENIPKDSPAQPLESTLDDIMGGARAYISGVQLRPIIDWEMGENDDEAEVRADSRELAINGRHKAFRTADRLDGNETMEGTDLEELRTVAALTIHIIDAASIAWGRWHFEKDQEDMDQFHSKYSELKDACLSVIEASK